MLAAVGNVGMDRRYSAGTVQDQNESFLSDSLAGKDPRSAGLFPTARGKRSSIGRSLSHGPRQSSATVEKRLHVARRSCSWPRIGGPHGPIRASGSSLWP